MNRFLEIISDDNDRLSSTRACMVFGVFTLAVLLFIIVFKDPADVGSVVYSFAGLCGGTYGVGKWQDAATRRAEINPNPPAPVTQSLGPVTVNNNAAQEKS